jgi:hypothetical protein
MIAHTRKNVPSASMPMPSSVESSLSALYPTAPTFSPPWSWPYMLLTASAPSVPPASCIRM